MSTKRCAPPLALIPTGLGINCEAETAHAFRLAGARVEAIHLNDLSAEPTRLSQARILALAGGFSFGDHLGAGKVYANRLLRRLGDALAKFVADGGLVIGICNGFQTLVRVGLVPIGTLGQQTVGLAHNAHGHFYDGWVRLAIDGASPCVFTRGLEYLDVPVRHGEGRLILPEPTRSQAAAQHLIPLTYADPATAAPTDAFPHNPNGSDLAAAGLCNPSGRVFGLMPHPEAFLYPQNHPAWRRAVQRRTAGGRGIEASGLCIFRNAVDAATF